MKTILWFIIFVIVAYMALHFLVMAGYMLLWSLHYAFPVLILLVAAGLLIGRKR